MEYIINFEIFGKKFRTRINATNPEKAEYLLKGKIYEKLKVTNIEPSIKPATDNDVLDLLKEFQK